jgi:hypothetical protein
MYCKMCTIKRTPTFVAYGGFYIYWSTNQIVHLKMASEAETFSIFKYL